MQDRARILIVEDNQELAFGLRTNLEVQGYEVRVAGDGPAGLVEADKHEPNLVILDLMLPHLGGMEVLETLRASGATMPILILTAKGNEVDKVNGLRLGADDYVTKPFALMELIARVEALLRRSPPMPRDGSDRFAFGDCKIDLGARQVTRNGVSAELAPKEFDLLIALLRRDGEVVSRLELLSEVWGHSSAVISRTVDTHIAELRRKLEPDPARPRYIQTVRKAGYRLVRDT